MQMPGKCAGGLVSRRVASAFLRPFGICRALTRRSAIAVTCNNFVNSGLRAVSYEYFMEAEHDSRWFAGGEAANGSWRGHGSDARCLHFFSGVMFAGTPVFRLMMNSATCLPRQQGQLTLTGQCTFPAPIWTSLAARDGWSANRQ
jgi:hypothetical protein